MYRNHSNGLNRSATDDVRKLRDLASDLERIAAGNGPTEAELAAAPLLDFYGLLTRPVPCLYGDVEGHPLLKGPLVETSQLWVLDQERGWARTYSRFYRLGVTVEGAFEAAGFTVVGPKV